MRDKPGQGISRRLKTMVLPGYIVEAATRETDSSDLETLKDWVEESGGDINDVDEDGCTILNLS